jgi:hypothetical protein
MKIFRVMCAAATLLLPTAVTYAQSPPLLPKAGDEYEIRKSYETSEQSSDGGSSSSSGHDTLLERVIDVRADGKVLEFDLSKNATAQDRGREWKFPARVFKPLTGSMRLLNRAALEARLEKWLKAAKWTRDICGHWIFTWNAFQIDCEPQTVIEIVESYDLTSTDLSEGASYQTSGARGPGTLSRKSIGPDGATFAAVMEIDPEAVRRARAESDVAAGEIMQKPVTFEAALRERAKETVSGKISVTFQTDAAGRVRRRVKVTKLQMKSPDGRSENRTATETLERRLLLGPSSHQ